MKSVSVNEVKEFVSRYPFFIYVGDDYFITDEGAMGIARNFKDTFSSSCGIMLLHKGSMQNPTDWHIVLATRELLDVDLKPRVFQMLYKIAEFLGKDHYLEYSDLFVHPIATEGIMQGANWFRSPFDGGVRGWLRLFPRLHKIKLSKELWEFVEAEGEAVENLKNFYDSQISESDLLKSLRKAKDTREKYRESLNDKTSA